MRVAICDDEQKELTHLQTLVRQYDSNIETALFQSAEKLLTDINKQSFDIILLDIEMDGMNGFDAAQKLLKMQNPPLVVFVTNSGEYTYRGYGVAFRYLPKPVSYEVLVDVISAAIDKISPQKITIASDGQTYAIPTTDIFYFETFGHHVVIYTKQRNFDCRMKLRETEALLPMHTFAPPHKGYLVNLNYVDVIGENKIMLTNGLEIPISRRQKQSFEQALFRFVRKLR